VVYVTKRVDEFVPPNRWIASLSNGETIFEDHKKNEDVAWERLARYVEENGLSITQLRVQFQNGSEVKLPANAQGYVQKKRAWSTGATSGACFCIGYADSGLSLIHELSEDMSSVTKYGVDPGEPWTIYRKDIREAKYATSSTIG
jgi:hypothetical protein